MVLVVARTTRAVVSLAKQTTVVDSAIRVVLAEEMIQADLVVVETMAEVEEDSEQEVAMVSVAIETATMLAVSEAIRRVDLVQIETAMMLVVADDSVDRVTVVR